VKVLVAEDESLIRLDLVETLKSLDFEVVAAVGNGEEAVAAAKKLEPDVVLLDVKMPIMDGLSAAEALTEHGYCCILITAFSSTEIVNRAVEIGVDGYIVKPWRIDNLRPAIEIGYAQSRRRNKLVADVESSQQELADQKLIDRARAIVISKYQISEAEAFKVMQRSAMDGRVPMIEIARTIIDLDN
jgi:response regulator NasT